MARQALQVRGRMAKLREQKSPQHNTRVLNIEIGFADALKLQLAAGECIRKLNSYKRSTSAGKRTALNLATHLSKGRVTINEAKQPVKT